MPQYETTETFERDYRGLTQQQKGHFKDAVRKFVEDLRRGDGTIRSSLGIRPVRKAGGYVFEFHFERNGRATFHYGKCSDPNDVLIVWRRIGTHDIYEAP